MNDGGLHRSEAGFKALKLGLIAKRKNPMYMYSMKKVVKALRRLAYSSLIIIPALLLSGCSEDLYGKVTVTDQQSLQTGMPTLAAPEITVSVNKNYYRISDRPDITITAEADATITYYRNGDPSTATGYTGNFQIDSSVSSITAYATRPGYNDSTTTTHNFYFVASGAIVTIAGRSTGDNGSYAIQAALNGPGQICAITTTPLFYFTEAGQNRVRTIDSNSRVQAYAGTGAVGSTTDGDPAISATLRAPSGVCSDGANTYIVDRVNNTVLQVNSAGIIRKICTPETQTMNPLTGTNTDFRPTGICLDPGNPNPPTPRDPCLYITDAGNDCVWSVPVPGGVASPGSMMAGTLSRGILDPVSVCFDPATSDLYVVCAFARTVWRVPSSGAELFIGPALQGTILSSPIGICVDANYLYIADTGNHCIRRAPKSGTLTAADIATIVGDPLLGAGFSGDRGPATSALLNSPEGVFVHDNQVYIADTGNNCIRQILSY